MDDHRTTEDVISGPIELTRSEEVAVAGTQRVVTGRVRVTKRVVVEERTVTVPVRREEVVVEHLGPDDALAPDAVTAGAGGTSAPVVDLILHEEQVEVVTRAVPTERVRVFVDTVRETVAVDTTLAREVIDVTTEPSTGI